MKNLLSFFPFHIVQAVQGLNFEEVQEIRLRSNNPLVIQKNGKNCYLGSSGVTNRANALMVSRQDVQGVFVAFCEHSVYCHNEQIKKGFLAVDKGFRVGLAGQVSIDGNGQVETIREISSLNIRIAHQVKDCSKVFFDTLLKRESDSKSSEIFLKDKGSYESQEIKLKEVETMINKSKENKQSAVFDQNILVVGSSGSGKTTFLRDLILQTSRQESPPNVFLCDERNEVSATENGDRQYDLGDFCDVLTFSAKKFAFEVAIRTMNPNIICCDEIAEGDLAEIEKVCNSGVKIFATIHAQDYPDLTKKDCFQRLQKIFDTFVVLSKEKQIGEVVTVVSSI